MYASDFSNESGIQTLVSIKAYKTLTFTELWEDSCWQMEVKFGLSET
jgi:hypothetical protein